MTAIAALRGLVDAGLRDHDAAWKLVAQATKALPSDPRVTHLQTQLVDLLHAIEIETILGGDTEAYKQQLSSLLDWIEKQPSNDESV